MVEELTNKTIVNLTSRLALPSSVSVYKGNEENKKDLCHLQIIVRTNLISQKSIRNIDITDNRQRKPSTRHYDDK